MNNPLYPDDPETRITALLLGELDPAQEAEVRACLARDPELARLHDRLKATIGLVRQTLAPAAPGAANASPDFQPSRMSEARRERLLKEFRTVRMPAPGGRMVPRPRRPLPWQFNLALAAVLVALLSLPTLVLPFLSRAKSLEMASTASVNRPEGPLTERYNLDRIVTEVGDEVAVGGWHESTPSGAAPEQQTQVLGFVTNSRGITAVASRPTEAGGRAVADYDNDGLLDLYAARSDTTSRRRSAGYGTFEPATRGDDSAALGELALRGGGYAAGGFGGGGGSGPTDFGVAAAPTPTAGAVTHFYSSSVPDGVPTGAPSSVTLGESDKVLSLADAPALGRLLAEAEPAAPGQSVLNEQLAEQLARPQGITRGGRAETRGRSSVFAWSAPSAGLPPTEPLPPAAQSPAVVPSTGQPEVDSLMLRRYGLARSEPAVVTPAAPTAAPVLPPVEVAEVVGVDTAGEALVPLDIKLPVPAFMGTPTDIPLREPTAARAAASAGEGRTAGIAGGAVVLGQQLERLAEAKSSETAQKKVELPQLGVRSGDTLATVEEVQRGVAVREEVAALEAAEVGKPLTAAADGRQLTREQAGPAGEPESLGLMTQSTAGTGLATEPTSDNGVARVNTVALHEAEHEVVRARPAVAIEPQPEVVTAEDPFSTFSLNVTDVSYKLAAASLQGGQMPESTAIRSEEFINAFHYGDPEPAPGRRVGLTWERARYPFAHHRDLLRLSVKTAAHGRESARPLNLVLCLDSSGSMERADRVQIVREALAVLARQLQPADRVSVVAFARTARLWIDALPGNEMDELLRQVAGLVPQGGTNLEEALRLAYATAARHHQPGGVSRVVLLTDGAANLGDVEPESLRELVVAQRRQGIALDCFGVGWDGYQDELLETLSRNGDGRYGFLNTPEEAVTGFADQLAGALQVAASDVKIQIEFNPQRVRHHRLIGYAKHQLTREQFRDNTVDAAELGAAESGNALYVIETDPAGSGPLGVARVRYKLPATDLYEEVEWVLAYEGPGIALDRASPALRLAGSAAAFAEWLASNPYAAEVSPAALLELMRGIPEVYTLDPRPRQLEWMIRQAGSISGR